MEDEESLPFLIGRVWELQWTGIVCMVLIVLVPFSWWYLCLPSLSIEEGGDDLPLSVALQAMGWPWSRKEVLEVVSKGRWLQLGC